MLVVDASAIVDFLIAANEAGEWARGELALEPDALQAPSLIDYEVVSALRRQVAMARLSADRGASALEDLADARLVRHDGTALLGRMWALRDTHTSYAAAYVALAEALECPLVTTDEHLARSHGHRAVIRSPFG